MLNGVPNNNDVMRIVNIMLNEAPNSNDAMHIGNNVRLTAVGAQQFSIVTWLYSHHTEKPPYQR